MTAGKISRLCLWVILTQALTLVLDHQDPRQPSSFGGGIQDSKLLDLDFIRRLLFQLMTVKSGAKMAPALVPQSLKDVGMCGCLILDHQDPR